MNDDIAIKVESVSKSFKLPHEKSGTVKSALLGWRKRKRGYEMQHVLKDVSFEIKKGEFFGIVGRNGSGKSTLLKLISQIYTPDKGSITVNGKLTPFIELGVGFNPELSGRDNVYLNGSLLGFSREEMEAMYDEIVEFAELERFMDQKLKNYSSGMQVRLAFSIAIRANTDILVLDEVLAVGDEAFQRKCNEYFEVIRKDKTKTVILVTHGMDNVRKYCSKAMMVRNGEIVVIGSPEDVANEYSIENLKMSNGPKDNAINDGALIKDLQVGLVSRKIINQDDEVEVMIRYKTDEDIRTKVYLSIIDIDREAPLFGTNSPLVDSGKVEATFKLKPSVINDTNMKIQVSIRSDKGEVLHFLPDDQSPLISLRRQDYPNVRKKHTWAILYDRGEWS